MVKLIAVLVATVISGFLCRCGGMSIENDAKPEWIPKWLRKSWFRDWLCPAVLLLLVFCFWRPSSLLSWVMLLPYYGLSGAALSTYWDEMAINKGQDNYWMHGFGCGLAGFCLIAFVPWWIITIRMVICTIGMGLWSKWISRDWMAEGGRGILFIL